MPPVRKIEIEAIILVSTIYLRLENNLMAATCAPKMPCLIGSCDKLQSFDCLFEWDKGSSMQASSIVALCVMILVLYVCSEVLDEYFIWTVGDF